jgi:hypothetical protein
LPLAGLLTVKTAPSHNNLLDDFLHNSSLVIQT